MNCNPRIVIALGGNALQSKDSDSTAEAQLEVVRRTCERIADISCAGYEMAVVHGQRSPGGPDRPGQRDRQGRGASHAL